MSYIGRCVATPCGTIMNRTPSRSRVTGMASPWDGVAMGWRCQLTNFLVYWVPSMRALGLDLGEKTIGVAVSDGLGITAQGVTTLVRRSLDYDLEEIQKIAREYEATEIVVGLPLKMDGSEGVAVEKTRRFIDALKHKIGIDVVAWDERLSTVGAERTLLEADLSRAKRRKVINKMAAVFILQGYMDFQGR